MIPEGKRVTLTATLTALYDAPQGFRILNIRNYNANSIMHFAKSSDEADIIGFLNGGEAHAFRNVDGSKIYVKGAAGDILYVNGDVA